MSCDQELCANWTGHGCICEAIGLEPECGPCTTDTHQHCVKGGADKCCCGKEWTW